MNFKIIENAPDNFEKIYPQVKELLDTTTLTLCEILTKFDIACNNNHMYRKISKTYANEKGFNLRHRKGKIQRGLWL